jgi:hypothetical protein
MGGGWLSPQAGPLDGVVIGWPHDLSAGWTSPACSRALYEFIAFDHTVPPPNGLPTGACTLGFCLYYAVTAALLPGAADACPRIPLP